MKEYIKHNDKYKVTEYAPRNKGSISNYNSPSNNNMLIADGYVYAELEQGYDGMYVKGYTPVKPEPTKEEIRAERSRLYIALTDEYMYDIEELEAIVALTPDNEEAKTELARLQQEWLQKKNEIREQNPYPVEGETNE